MSRDRLPVWPNTFETSTPLYDELCSLLNCQNEGVCEYGACMCKPGYVGTSCEKQEGNSAQPIIVFSVLYGSPEDFPDSLTESGFDYLGFDVVEIGDKETLS